MGGDIIILDDPQKPLDAQSEALRNRMTDWLPNTLLPRLDDKEAGAIVIVTQRLHMEDLSGFLITERRGWKVLSLPAIAETDEHIQIGENEFHHRKVGEPYTRLTSRLKSPRSSNKNSAPTFSPRNINKAPFPPVAT